MRWSCVARWGVKALVLGALIVAELSIIVCEFGPPAGYAHIRGELSYASGARASEIQISVSGCESDFVPHIGVDWSTLDGTYQIERKLGPIDIFPYPADSVPIKCFVFVNRASAPIDSLEVRFAVHRADVIPQTLNLTIP
jgi:hypothetical protein